MRALALVALLLACDRAPPTPPPARESLPIRYMICDENGADCQLSARFRDLPSCEQHRKYGQALCDSVSRPGVIICNTNAPPGGSSSFCARD